MTSSLCPILTPHIFRSTWLKPLTLKPSPCCLERAKCPSFTFSYCCTPDSVLASIDATITIFDQNYEWVAAARNDLTQPSPEAPISMRCMFTEWVYEVMFSMFRLDRRVAGGWVGRGIMTSLGTASWSFRIRAEPGAMGGERTWRCLSRHFCCCAWKGFRCPRLRHWASFSGFLKIR